MIYATTFVWRIVGNQIFIRFQHFDFDKMVSETVIMDISGAKSLAVSLNELVKKWEQHHDTVIKIWKGMKGERGWEKVTYIS